MKEFFKWFYGWIKEPSQKDILVMIGVVNELAFCNIKDENAIVIHVLKAKSEGCFFMNQIIEKAIENELTIYADRRMVLCLDSFEPFDDYYFIKR